MPHFTDLLSALTPSCPGVRPAPVLRLQRDALRGAPRRRGPGHGRRHPRRLLPAPDPQEAPQRGRQQPKVIPIYFYRVFFIQFCWLSVSQSIFLAAILCIQFPI